MNTLAEMIARLDLLERLDALARRLSGQRGWRIWVPRDCGWSGLEMEQLLDRYGVPVWDRGFTREHFVFRVKLRQANWAEYLLLRRGIPVVGQLFNPLNAEYGRRHAPGSEPSQGKQPPRFHHRLLEDLLSPLLLVCQYCTELLAKVADQLDPDGA
jgi:hypothetical protein